MNCKHVRLLVGASALALATTAQAGFVNGGFETGDFTGWTVEWTTYSNAWNLGPGPAGNVHQKVVSGTTIDPYTTVFDSPFEGTYMAQLNEPGDVNGHRSRISQTATMLAGESAVYINWGAVMQDPSHSAADQPFFEIEVLVGGTRAYYFQHTAGAGGNAGWTSQSGIFWKSGQAALTGLNTGDSVKVILTVADCDLGGHFGYAYLDGIGTVAPPPPPGTPGVPDGGLTAAMLASALLGLAALRRRF